MSNAGLCNCNVIFKILWIFVSFKPCESITLNVLWYHCLIVIMYVAWRIEQFFSLEDVFYVQYGYIYIKYLEVASMHFDYAAQLALQEN